MSRKAKRNIEREGLLSDFEILRFLFHCMLFLASRRRLSARAGGVDDGGSFCRACVDIFARKHRTIISSCLIHSHIGSTLCSQ